MEREGFEPSKAEPADLQSAPFGHSGTSPLNRGAILRKSQPYVNHYSLKKLHVEIFFHYTAWMNIYSATVTLFLVMDPLGNIPIFLSLLGPVAPKRRTQIILRENGIAFVILTLFLFFGKAILHGLQISEQALSIAGGIILFLIALKMLFPSSARYAATEINEDEPFIVPMAIPLLAGPSAMATVILLSSQDPQQLGYWFISLVLASLLATLTLLFAVPLQRLLGAKVIGAFERLMGMILTTIAVQMFLSGLTLYFKSVN